MNPMEDKRMKKKEAFALEINTAPGLEGATVGIYAQAIRRMVNDQ